MNGNMNGPDLTAWRKRNKISRQALADLVGISASVIGEYERGQRKGNRGPCFVPRYLALSCAAIELGLNRYDGQPIKLVVSGI